MERMRDCASYDLKAYQLGEASPSDRRAVELHARSCETCASELDRLNFTQAALLMGAREEEMPRRIAFVSDKLFEPKWYQRLWSAPQWGFASAGLLAGAIVFHALWLQQQQQPQPQQQQQVAAATTAVAPPQPQPVVVDTQAIVAKAVAEADARNEKRTRLLLAEVEKRHEAERLQMMAAVNASFSELSKRFNNAVKTAAIADTRFTQQ